MLEALGGLQRKLNEGTLSVGVDSWGVDYGLVDVDGRLLGPPFHYRDDRTVGRLEELDRVVGLEPLYDRRGRRRLPSTRSASSWPSGAALPTGPLRTF